MRARVLLRMRSEKSLQTRQLLLDPPDVLPWIATDARQPLTHVLQGELVSGEPDVELAPVDRRRHRRAFAGAGRIRHDRSRAAAVAQIVDKDAAFALALGHFGNEPIGSVRLHFQRY